MVNGKNLLRILCIFIGITSYNCIGMTVEKKPYHHLPDGTFRNPKGSPVVISRSGKFSYRTFSKLRKKVNLSYPKEHVIEKEKVLANLKKYKDSDYIAWIGHALSLIHI